MSLELGIKGSASCTVTKDLTAKALRSGRAGRVRHAHHDSPHGGGLPRLRAPYLEPGMDTVGTHLDVSHLSPPPWA